MAVLTLHTASLSSLSSPRITILTASSRSGLCSALTSSHGPRNHMWGASGREEVSDYGSHQEWPTFCVRNTFLEDLHAGHGRCPVLGGADGTTGIHCDLRRCGGGFTYCRLGVARVAIGVLFSGPVRGVTTNWRGRGALEQLHCHGDCPELN